MIDARLTQAEIDAPAELAAFTRRAGIAGAIVSFTGLVRGADRSGATVDSLFLDHYPGMTEASLQRIAAVAQARDEVDAVVVVHRCGVIEAGATIVFVAAASAHRRAAFLAADELMDRLKTEAMFWKRERGAAGERWIEPTDNDRRDAARWSDMCPE